MLKVDLYKSDATKFLIEMCIRDRYLPYEVNIIENPKEVNLNVNKENLDVVNENGQIKLSTLEVDHSSPCLGYSFYFNRDRKFSVEKAEGNNVPKVLWNKLQKGNEEFIIYKGREYKKEMVLGDDRKGIKLSLITDSRPQEEMINFIKESDSVSYTHLTVLFLPFLLLHSLLLLP